METNFTTGECSVCHKAKRVTITPLDDGPICANCWADRHVCAMTPEEEAQEIADFNARLAVSGMTESQFVELFNQEVRDILRRAGSLL